MNFPKLQGRFGLDTTELVERLGRISDLLPFNSDTRSKGSALAAHLEATLDGKPLGQTSWGDEPSGPPMVGAAAGQPPTDKGELPIEGQTSLNGSDTSLAHLDPRETPVEGQSAPLGEPAKKRK